MAYSADSFTALEVPTLAKMNKLWSNDASFNDGTGIANNAIIDRHILTGNLKNTKISNPHKFSVYRNAAQNATTNVYTKVNFDTEEFDTGGNFDNVTNYRFVAPVAGFYQFSWSVALGIGGGSVDTVATLYKNGVVCKWGNELAGGGGSTGSCHIQVSATDYFEVYVFSSTTQPMNVGSAKVFFTGYLTSTT